MSLTTPSQSVSHKQFHQCMNHKKKLCLRHPLPTFGSFSYFQVSRLRVDKVLQKLTKSHKSELRHLFWCCILIPRKCPRKTPFQHTVTPPPLLFSVRYRSNSFIFIFIMFLISYLVCMYCMDYKNMVKKNWDVEIKASVNFGSL
jgi:hypothetical protein